MTHMTMEELLADHKTDHHAIEYRNHERLSFSHKCGRIDGLEALKSWIQGLTRLDASEAKAYDLVLLQIDDWIAR